MVFDLRQFLSADRLGMGEIEAQPIGGDQRAFLRDMIAEHFAQRGMQKMGGGMVGAGGAAPLVIDLEIHGIAERDLAFLDDDDMDVQGAKLLLACCRRALRAPGACKTAGVADLAAGFGIERRLV